MQSWNVRNKARIPLRGMLFMSSEFSLWQKIQNHVYFNLFRILKQSPIILKVSVQHLTPTDLSKMN